MEPLLTDDQAQVQSAVTRIIAEMAGPARLRALRDDPQALDQPAWTALCEAQWPLLLAPTAVGGHGLGATELAMMAEATGEHLLQAPLIESVVGLDLFAKLTGRLPEASPALDPALAMVVWQGPQERTGRADSWPVALQTTSGWRLHGPAVRLPRW